jgi:hypothetical protein
MHSGEAGEKPEWNKVPLQFHPSKDGAGITPEAWKIERRYLSKNKP